MRKSVNNMISKTKIHERMQRKRNSELVETILLAKKNNLLELAKRLSGPTRQQSSVNLNELNELKENKVIVVGRVLGSGGIKKKIGVAALGFSTQSREKLKKAGCEIKTIKQALLEKSLGKKGVRII